VPCIMVS